MSAFFLRPIPIVATAVNAQPNATVANIADPQPKVVFSTAPGPVNWAVRIDVDLGRDEVIDTAALLFHTGAVSASNTWRLWARTDAEGPFGISPGVPETVDEVVFSPVQWATEPTIDNPRRHGLWLGSPQPAHRYYRFGIQSLTGTQPTWSCGVIALGRRLQPPGDFGLDWGGGRRVGDLSAVRVLDGGERGIWKKARVPEIRGSFSHLTDAELRDWWRILNQVGESDPILLVEDGAATTGQQERIHYGTLTGLDFWERRQSDKSRIDFRLTHWL